MPRAPGSRCAWAPPCSRSPRGPRPPHALDWQPSLAWQQPWRWWSAACVHWSALHLVSQPARAGGRRRFRLAARAAAGRGGGLARRLAADAPRAAAAPRLLHYGGLSGVLHAGVVVAACWLAVRATGPRAGHRRGGGGGPAVKVLTEAPWGPTLRMAPGWDIAIAPLAHVSGAAAGVLCALLCLAAAPAHGAAQAVDRSMTDAQAAPRRAGRGLRAGVLRALGPEPGGGQGWRCAEMPPLHAGRRCDRVGAALLVAAVGALARASRCWSATARWPAACWPARCSPPSSAASSSGCNSPPRRAWWCSSTWRRSSSRWACRSSRATSGCRLRQLAGLVARFARRGLGLRRRVSRSRRRRAAMGRRRAGRGGRRVLGRHHAGHPRPRGWPARSAEKTLLYQLAVSGVALALAPCWPARAGRPR